MELATRSELRWALVRAMAMVATLVVMFAAIASKFGAAGRAAWFAGLYKPRAMLSPEAFTLWWALVFLLVGLALAIVWQARGATYRRLALITVLGFLISGLLWSPITFGLRHLSLGVAIAGGMSFFAALASYFSFKVRKFAGALLVLATLWTAFCTYAAVQLWHLNGATAVVATPNTPNMAGEDTRFGNP
jgi:translocator protein